MIWQKPALSYTGAVSSRCASIVKHSARDGLASRATFEHPQTLSVQTICPEKDLRPICPSKDAMLRSNVRQSATRINSYPSKP